MLLIKPQVIDFVIEVVVIDRFHCIYLPGASFAFGAPLRISFMSSVGKIDLGFIRMFVAHLLFIAVCYIKDTQRDSINNMTIANME